MTEPMAPTNLAATPTARSGPPVDRRAVWSRALDRSAASETSVVIGSAVVAVAFDIAARHHAASFATFLFVTIVVFAMWSSGHLDTKQSRVTAALAPAFAVWLILRSSPWLVAFNLLASLGLVASSIVTAQNGWLFRYGFRDLLAAPRRLAVEMFDAAAVVGLTFFDRETPRTRRLSHIASGIALAAPVVVGIGALLATGDEAFSELLSGVTDSGIASHLGLLAIGGFVGFSLLRSTALDDAAPLSDSTRKLGPIESITVLWSLGALYTLFAAAQVVASFSNLGEVLESPVATRVWVHDGFFRLMWASAITLATLFTIDHVARVEDRRQRRWYRSSVVGVVALTLVAVAVAVFRIAQYSHTFGLTMLRLYSMWFAGWIGVVFVLFSISTWGIGARRRWFPSSVVIASLVVLFTVNLTNPERMVAEYNLDRAPQTDLGHLARLSDDGIAVLADRVEEVGDLAARQELTNRLCRRSVDDSGGLNWNLARSNSAAALDRLC